MPETPVRACLRCHRRKCTGYPDCRSCHEAKVQCEAYHRPRRADTSQVLQNAQKRIQWLEAALSVELGTDCKSIATGTPLVRSSSVATGSLPQRRHEEVYRHQESKSPSVIESPGSHSLDREDESDIGLLASVNAPGELRNLGPSSKAFFTNYATALVRACGLGHMSRVKMVTGKAAQLNIHGDQANQWSVDDGPQCTLHPEHVQLLLKSYELWSHPLYPLFETDHLRQLVARCSEPQEGQDAHRSGSDAPEEAAELTMFYMVMALGAANLGSTIKHLGLPPAHSIAEQPSPDAIFATGAHHFDRIIARQFRPTISLIRTILLVCIYSSYGSTGYSQWQLSGLAMRTATEIGLHHGMPQRSLGQQDSSESSEKDGANRVFWTAYTIEISLAYNLGRPPSISEQHITAALPDRDGAGDSAIYHINHRQIQARILERVYGGRCRVHPPTPEQREAIIVELQSSLDEWWDALPTQTSSSGGDASGSVTAPYPRRYWDRLYHGTSFVLHRASPLCPLPPVSSLERCIRSAGAYVDSITDILRGSHVPLSWMLVQGLLFAGLSMLATARTSFQRLATHAGVELLMVELPAWTRKCSVSLAIMVERMGDDLVARLDTQFEVLANSTLALVSTGLTMRPGQAKEQQSEQELESHQQQQLNLATDVGGIDQPPLVTDHDSLEMPDGGIGFDWGSLDNFRELLGIDGSDFMWDSFQSVL